MTSICLGLMLSLAAPNQTAAAPEPDLRAARDDAHRRLAKTLATIRIDENRTLADVLDDDTDAIDAVLPVARRARDVGKPVIYTDKTLELHVALEPVDVRDEVRTRLVRRKTSAMAIRSTLDALSDAALAECSVAAGFASPRLPADLTRHSRHKYEATLFEMTTEAAILDARRQLVDRIGQLRITGRKKLEDVLLQTPGLEDELLKAIPISVFGPTRQRSNGNVEVSVSITPQHALELTVESLTRLSVDSPPPKLALESNATDPIIVRGIGVRPSQATLVRIGLATAESADTGDAVPAWDGRALIAEGDARVAGGESRTTGAVAAAMDDAEFSARRRLAQQIDELKLPDGRTVRDEILSRRIATVDLMRFLGSADRFGMANATQDGRVRVRVRVPLAGLWRLIQDAGAQPPNDNATGGTP